jgi:YjbE family integral membrane protein
VCWKMWRELQSSLKEEQEALEALTGYDINADGTIAGYAPRKSLGQAAGQIIVADLSMSLDNVLAVAGAAREHPIVLVFGLGLSIILMGIAASFIARLLQKHRWIAYIGLAVILYVALGMVYRGALELRPIVSAVAGLQ